MCERMLNEALHCYETSSPYSQDESSTATREEIEEGNHGYTFASDLDEPILHGNGECPGCLDEQSGCYGFYGSIVTPGDFVCNHIPLA